MSINMRFLIGYQEESTFYASTISFQCGDRQRPIAYSIHHACAQSRGAWLCKPGYASRTITGLAPLTALAIAAEATMSLRVGSYVFCNDYRHPALLAKEVATLDFLSGGRFELGLGAGAGPFDYQQLGLPFDKGDERVDSFEEALSVIKKLFTEESVNFSGKHYTITGMKGLPRSIQKPHPPIAIGGTGKRMLSLAVREADSISIMFRLPTQGIDADNESLQQKLACVREAAGECFARLELSQLAYVLAINDGRTERGFEGDGPPIPRIVMSAGQAVEHLLEQREHYGFLYIPVYRGEQMERFTPAVTQLAGK